jgi:hypothetical protein
VILAAGLFVLLGLALFVAGVITGSAVLYWLCVAVCAVAGALLLLARRTTTAGDGRSRPTSTTGRTAVEGAASAPPVAGAGAAAGTPPAGTGAGAEHTGATAATAEPVADGHESEEPPVEEVEVTDLLLIVDLRDEILVVDEHPRYHLPGCTSLSGRETFPLPVDEARTDGFTPCGLCEPDRHLAEAERARRAARRAD